MSDPDFDVFKNRWTIIATLELETPLRIGGGQNAAAYSMSAAPVLQTYNAGTKLYEPYIPGSSLKGVLRSTVERLIRTFNEKESCISVGESRPCGREECLPCGIFGSMKAGAKIRVRDSHVSGTSKGIFGSTKEQPHCATLYDRNLIPLTKPRFVGNRKIESAKTILRMEEIINSGIRFDVMVDVDNANEQEIGLILLALLEFNNKRVHLGGGATRGNGFADVGDINVRKKSINEGFKVTEQMFDINELIITGKKYLKNIDKGIEAKGRDFDIYYKARSPSDVPKGHIVALMKMTALTDFIMPGVEEETVTSGGLPVIPGSTIKGFFRHSMIDKGIDAGKIKEIFGFTDRDSRRARLLVSDAYCDDITDPKKIPAGTVLKMWMVFDNMTSDEIKLIEEYRKGRLVITGKTSAKWDAARKCTINNAVSIEYERIDMFRASSYLDGV